jgi:hypothetical protein
VSRGEFATQSNSHPNGVSWGCCEVGELAPDATGHEVARPMIGHPAKRIARTVAGDPGQFLRGQLVLAGRRRARLGIPVLLRPVGRVVVLGAQPVQPRLPLPGGRRVAVRPGGIVVPPGVRGGSNSDQDGAA